MPALPDPAAGPPELAGRLLAAAALLGFPVTVTAGEDWELSDDGLRVGLGFYAARGHGPDEAVALALLQLWESVRAERTAPEAARRARSIVASRPELGSLVRAVARLQAAGALLAALPGLRAGLAAAVHRGVPEDLVSWPRHLQWAGLLLRAGMLGRGAADGAPAVPGAAPGGGPTGPDAPPPAAVDAEVRAEWDRIASLAGPGGDPLRRALAAEPDRPPIRRFERALALVLPAYERLLARDAAERGSAAADARGPSGPPERDAPPGDPELGAPAAGADAGQEADADREAAPDAATVPPAEEQARRGEGRQASEGADLFAAEQAGFVRSILPTPLPGAGALVEALVRLARERTPEPAGERARRAERPGGAPAGAETGAALDYRERAAALAEPIERMREVWARVIAERVAHRPAMGRRPGPEGEVLDGEALARAVAEARAGVPRPAAFRRREARPRRTRAAGSTDYVLLVDRSASMQGAAADAAADAALIMLEALAGAERDARHAEAAAGIPLDLDLRTALVVFDADVEVVKPLSRGLDDAVRRRMHAAIRSPRGSTNDGAALRAAAEQLALPGPGGRTAGDPASAAASQRRASAGPGGDERRRVVILVGDGGSNDPVAAERALRRLHAAGVRVHGVGLGSDEVARRFAPTSVRLDDPARIADALRDVVERELPAAPRPARRSASVRGGRAATETDAPDRERGTVTEREAP